MTRDFSDSYQLYFYYHTVSSGVIPQIGLLMGPCAAGAAYSPILTDFLIMVKKTSHMYIASPTLIKSVQFINVTEGVNAPVGEVYFSAENPKGELGFYIVSKGGGVPHRLKIRAPSFANLQALPVMAKDHIVSDLVAILGSIDFVMGECDR